MKHTLFQKKKNAGFTLLETLVGVSILILAITATFTAAQSGLSSSIESRDQITAFFLAQEAVEMIRNIRDENSIQNINWLTGVAAVVNDPCYFGQSCTVDAVTKVFTRCSALGSCSNIRQDRTVSSPTYGMYGYNGSWTTTNFNRDIQLTSSTSTEVTVTVTMSWTKGILTRTFKVSEVVRDWQ